LDNFVFKGYNTFLSLGISQYDHKGVSAIKRHKSKFGQILERYRFEQGISQTELQNILADCGFFVSTSIINKYELGSRKPSPEFIYYLSKCLNLNSDWRDSLLHACVDDIVSEFINEYNKIVQENNK
jgi:transcriptional regulator with XRE-family HTH domain